MLTFLLGDRSNAGSGSFVLTMTTMTTKRVNVALIQPTAIEKESPARAAQAAANWKRQAADWLTQSGSR